MRTLFLFLLPSAPQCQKTWDGANSKETNWTEAGLLCPCHEATSTPEQRITIPILKNGKWKLFVIPEGISQVRMEEADAKLLTNITLQEETDRVTKEGVPQWETLICFIHSTAAALEVTEQFQADFCPQPHPLLSGNLLCHYLGVRVGSFHWIFVIYDFRGTQMLHFPKKPQKFSQKTWDLLAVRSVYPPLIQKTLKIWQYKLQPIDKDISRLC